MCHKYQVDIIYCNDDVSWSYIALRLCHSDPAQCPGLTNCLGLFSGNERYAGGSHLVLLREPQPPNVRCPVLDIVGAIFDLAISRDEVYFTPPTGAGSNIIAIASLRDGQRHRSYGMIDLQLHCRTWATDRSGFP